MFIKVFLRAYLKIQDGCNQFCTYCMIPYVRGKGKLVSMPEDEVISHVESLAKQGYKEVVLTGAGKYEIILAEDNKTLDEVIVVGYGTQKKATLTGSRTSSMPNKPIEGDMRSRILRR